MTLISLAFLPASLLPLNLHYEFTLNSYANGAKVLMEASIRVPKYFNILNQAEKLLCSTFLTWKIEFK